MARRHLSPKKFSADLVPGTNCKSIVKGPLHDPKNRFMESLLLHLVSGTKSAEQRFWTKMVHARGAKFSENFRAARASDVRNLVISHYRLHLLAKKVRKLVKRT